jgi:hypothetical protein
MRGHVVALLAVVLAIAGAALLLGTRAEAHDTPNGAESSPPVSAASGAIAPDVAGSGWRGSILLFDQSMTTQTVGVGGDYQSSDPTYEWWLAFKPRYTIFDRERDALTVNLWMNAYLELTNSDTTTREHELLLGPTYLWASYARVFRDRGGYKTSAALGPRFTLPTDKAAFDAGQILGMGAIGGATQTFPLAGPRARAFTEARLGFATTYTRFLDRATSPVDGGLHRLREDLNGLSVSSDVLSGAMMVHDSLSVSVLGDVHLLRRLDLALSYVVINYWRYSAPSFQDCVPLTGCVTPMTNVAPTTYRVDTWMTASLTYDVSEELAVSAGYYNLTNQLAPDGTRRDPLWSPSARFFLTITANLDAIKRRFAHGAAQPAGQGEGPYAK